MMLKLNDIIDLGDGVNRLVVSSVTYNNIDYVLLLDEEEDKKICMLDSDSIIEVDINLLDIEIVNDLITMMNFNLDFNYDEKGMLMR